MATIMIVDDMEVIRQAMSTLLRFEGHTTLTAHNGAEAMTQIRDGSRPDLVLMDISMPEMDGLRALDALRHTAATRTTPVIMMSSQSDAATIGEAIRLGATEYLVKSQLSWEEVRERLGPYLPAPAN